MKKFLFSFLMFAAMLAPVVLISCKDDPDPGPEEVDNELIGEIGEVKNLDASVEYIIKGPVIVKDGATLNIPAGTVIKAEKGFDKYILVLQGGKINVNGTAEKPVTITANISNAEQGHWGGLIINGKAPLSGGTTGTTEINSDYPYGGTVANDNSGSITYLKLEYTGARSDADVEHNGLTLNGVGSGTKIENIYIPHGADDGIEFFGGSVNVKNLLVVNSDDDMFDFTQGYTGTLENAYGIWEPGFVSSESDPRGIEADGNHDGNFPTHSGQSNFTVRNMTIDLRLAASTTEGEYMHDVIKIRRGAKATIENALIKGVGQAKDLIDMNDGKGAGDPTSVISISNQLSTPLTGEEVNGEAQVTFDDNNTGCPTDIFAWTGYSFEGGSAGKSNLSGTIEGARTLVADIEYTLIDPLIVADGGVLNIPAGTVIKAEKGFDQYILVLQGGKINVNGTAEKPVTMTANISNAEQGHWGGLIINGKAPLSGGTTGTTEINSDYPYGGTVANDNSGSITYLKLEYTGARSDADVEHNGLTLNGVGSGTKIENIYIPHGADDGIEFFGGSVNVKNLLVVNSDDDMFDFTQGYTGTLENAYGIWEPGFVSSESDPRGIEADGNHDGNFPTHSGQSNFTVRNMTIDLRLAASTTEGEYMHDVIKIRRGAKATIENALIKGVGQAKDLIDMNDGKGAGDPTSVISISNQLSTPLTGEEVNGVAQVTLDDNNTGCPTDIFAWTGYNFGDTPGGGGVKSNLSGTIEGTRTLDADVEYLLTDPLIVKDGGVLNIPAGTVIKAEEGFDQYILVLQGGKINVNGTAEKPVTMTANISNAEQGHWGGLIINGKAPLSGGTTGTTEINSDYPYGGTVANDNSGSITYLKLEYTGARSDADVEHNGLTLNGVGSGTKIENIYIPHGADDGIEFFGGSVNVKNLLVVNSDDDMFDFTQGYTGTLENAYGIWEPGFVSSESDPRGIEADGNHDGNFPTHSGQSNFTVRNMTIDLRLAASTTEGEYMHDVIKIRRGAKATIENALIKGVGQARDLIDMNDGKGAGNPTSVISITNKLSTPLTGVALNGTAQVTTPDNNTGCPTDIFAWTGYEF